MTSSPHPKRQEQVDLVASHLDSPSTRSAVFRDTMLRRHDHRCTVTQALDVPRWKQLGRPENEIKAKLEAAHIIPFSFASYKDKDVCFVPVSMMMILNTNCLKAPPKHVSETWAMLYRCFPDLRSICNPAEINDPTNGLMLASPFHEEFGDLSLTFVTTVCISSF